MKPDVWFEPRQVWEVKAADLSVSPVHQAAHGLVDPVKVGIRGGDVTPPTWRPSETDDARLGFVPLHLHAFSPTPAKP